MLKRTDCQLEWTKAKVEDEFTRGSVNLKEQVGLVEIIQETGLPTFKEAGSPEQEALWLLEVAAEIEHALLVEYLYAAYSITPASSEFRREITNIAVQEMGHLITVQNLLLSLGGSVYLSRQDLSPQASLDPFPFELEPFSKKVLAKYVLTEMPEMDLLPESEQTEIEQIKNDHKVDMGTVINRVGALYVKLYWLFQSSDDPEGPWTLPLEMIPEEERGKHIGSLAEASASLSRQTDISEWQASVDGLEIWAISDRLTALEAIHRISAQGEGFAQGLDSHFLRFRELYRQYDSVLPIIQDVPTNPFTSPTPAADPLRELHRISHPVARILVDLADVRYRKMLLHLVQIFAYSKDGTDQEKQLRGDLIEWALGEMTGGIRALSRAVQNLPRVAAADTSSPSKAALALTISAEVFPPTKEEQWQLLSKLLDRSQELQAELNSLADVPSTLVNLVATTVLGDDNDKRATIANQTVIA